MKKFLSLLLILITMNSFANTMGNFNGKPYEKDSKIMIKNRVLVKVNDTTISMVDVMKKMDIAFLRAFPDLSNSSQAKFQFYTTGWRQMLNEMVNTELILADAQKKELQINDSEIREEIENRFGPNVIITLEKLNLSYDEAWKIVKNDMIVQRMTWFYVHAKALQKVTPESIKEAYKNYIIENPAEEIWVYQVISIKGEEPASKTSAEKLQLLLKDAVAGPDSIKEKIEDLEKNLPGIKVQISKLYTVSSKEISESNKQILSSLKNGFYSDVISVTGKNKNTSAPRIYYLKSYEKKEPSSFEEMANNLKEQLLNKAVAEEGNGYFSKLRKTYNFDEKDLLVPEDYQPFVLE
ncbi:MAG: SurA N-terminal domain-containing protein [Chlamydiae bacterium]|nr:SurA N-terminal domain-containing protein [Chlamydiota bacterium]